MFNAHRHQRQPLAAFALAALTTLGLLAGLDRLAAEPHAAAAAAAAVQAQTKQIVTAPRPAQCG
jgi:hypothetical protein